VFFTLGYDRLSRGEVEIPSQDLFRNDKIDLLSSTVSIKSTFNEETGLQLSLWTLRQTYDFTNNQLSSGAVLSNENFTDEGDGASAKVLWKRGSHNIVLGADYDARKLESNTLANGVQKLTKSAFFVNDTMSFYRLSVTPGLRQDRTNTNGNFTSPSLGLTYKIADGTLLRAYTAQGFNIPPLSATNINPDLKMEKVRSYELGAETAALQYLLLKLSGFRHDIRDAIGRDAITGNPVNSEKQERQGMEIEMKTAPVHSTSISVGASFIRVRDLNTGETVPDNPQRTYDVGLQYDDQKYFKALLKGHYIYWNTAPSPDPSFQGKYNSFIFDLYTARHIYSHDERVVEAFFDVHNIFNSSQYPLAIFKNPQRWIEAGIRYMF
jgi:vitamin B12 transporter